MKNVNKNQVSSDPTYSDHRCRNRLITQRSNPDLCFILKPDMREVTFLDPRPEFQPTLVLYLVKRLTGLGHHTGFRVLGDDHRIERDLDAFFRQGYRMLSISARAALRLAAATF